jgi:peptide subunit release factor RF-3
MLLIIEIISKNLSKSKKFSKAVAILTEKEPIKIFLKNKIKRLILIASGVSYFYVLSNFYSQVF